MANSADPKQLASSELVWIYTVCTGRAYQGSAGQGLKMVWTALSLSMKKVELGFRICQSSVSIMWLGVVSCVWGVIFQWGRSQKKKKGALCFLTHPDTVWLKDCLKQCWTWTKQTKAIQNCSKNVQTSYTSIQSAISSVLTIYSSVSSDSISEHWRLWSDCVGAKADLNLHCLCKGCLLALHISVNGIFRNNAGLLFFIHLDLWVIISVNSGKIWWSKEISN